MWREVIVLVIIVILLVKMYLKLITSKLTTKVCLIGKVAIVTGGSAGIGYEIAAGLASRGCKVIIANRRTDSSIREKLIEETHNPNVEIRYVDLASFQSIKKFAEQIKRSESKIDILINNSGIGTGYDRITEDDLNLCLQVNYYGSFLLTHLLIDLLQKSGQGRIIFTSSITAMVANVCLNNIVSKDNQNHVALAYPVAKYSSLVASDMFAEKLKKFNITSNCYHPGLVATSIFQKSLDSSPIQCISVLFLMLICFIVGKSAEEAAQVPVYLACANEVKDVTGEFFFETRPTVRPWKSRDPKFKKSLWEFSELVVGLEPHEKL